MSKRKKVENNLIYANEQVNRFIRYQYGIKYSIEVVGHKRLEKKGLYSTTVFSKGKPVEIILSYHLLIKSREKVLEAAIREAIKVCLWYRRKPYTETSKEYITELRRFNLPIYGNVNQTGKELHTYQCGSCKKIYMLRERKLSRTQDPSQRNILTPCCEEKFEYAGKILYTNKQLNNFISQSKK